MGVDRPAGADRLPPKKAARGERYAAGPRSSKRSARQAPLAHLRVHALGGEGAAPVGDRATSTGRGGAASAFYSSGIGAPSATFLLISSMSYNAQTVQFDDPERPKFITAGRENMVDAVKMLHHRIPWSHLRAALNNVLKGQVDVKLVNALLALAPGSHGSLLTDFKTALTWVQAKKTPTTAMVESLDAVEAEIFSLPCNLFLGPSERADDPGNQLDFTPDDVRYDGSRAEGNAGEIQAVRERVYGLIVAGKIDVDALLEACKAWAKLWRDLGGGLKSATGYDAAWWVPASPAYRRWTNPLTGADLSVDQIKTITDAVTARAIKLK